MNHQGTKTLETQRLLLRAFRPEDAEAAFLNWTSDESVTKYLRWPPHGDLAETKRVIADWVQRSENPDFYQWAIVLKAINEPIGSISVVEQDEALGSLQIGYCIGSKWWHQGVTSEAFSAIIRYLFDVVGTNRIEARHDPDNPHSGGVMRKCGLVYEGTLRQADRNNRGIVDVCVYSILKSDRETARQ